MIYKGQFTSRDDTIYIVEIDSSKVDGLDTKKERNVTRQMGKDLVSANSMAIVYTAVPYLQDIGKMAVKYLSTNQKNKRIQEH